MYQNILGEGVSTDPWLHLKSEIPGPQCGHIVARRTDWKQLTANYWIA